MATNGVAESSEYDEEDKISGKTPAQWQSYWQKEKDASDKRLEEYRKQGNHVVGRYLDHRVSTQDITLINESGSNFSSLNLFHTNVSTLQSMLFGSTPKIEVAREHQDPDDDIARVASMLFQRILDADVTASGDDLSSTLKACLQDRLLPGMGMARVHYSIDTETEEIETELEDGTYEKEESESLIDERCSTSYVHWQDVAWGWCRSWKELPWLGYRSYLSKREAIDRFGKDKAKTLEYKTQMPSGDGKEGNDSGEQRSVVKKAEIWEFWKKDCSKVFWWSESAPVILDTKDDPLELSGFWPSPMPMVANLTTTLFLPRADYVIAQDLYNQIDEINSRIQIITSAVKVVGVYDKNAGDSVGRMLKEGSENSLIPVDNWAMFAEKGGLAGQIDWFPVEDIVQTLSVLRGLLGETIDLLYQVTGMSDILRGANTDQYTSDGTNQLKAKFGSIRVQALQDEFARFASDLDALKAEVISRHYDRVTILQQSNAEFIPAVDKGKLGQAIELMKSPDVKWRVNIRPESIAMVDYAQLKQERTEFLMAMATYLQSATSMASTVPESLPILLEMLKWGMSGFKGSTYLEGIMDEAIEMAKKMPPPEDDGQQKEQEAQQQLLQVMHKNEMEKIQAKTQADIAVDQQKHRSAMEQEMADHQNKMQQEMSETQAKIQVMKEDFMAEVELIKIKLDADIETERAQSAYAIEEKVVEHDNAMVELEAQHAVKLEETLIDGEMAAVQKDRETDTD